MLAQGPLVVTSTSLSLYVWDADRCPDSRDTTDPAFKGAIHNGDAYVESGEVLCWLAPPNPAYVRWPSEIKQKKWSQISVSLSSAEGKCTSDPIHLAEDH